MKNQLALQHDMCALFDLKETGDGGWCIVTPLQYSGSGDQILVRAEPDGFGWVVHDNGDSVLNANLLGFDTESDAVLRWAEDLPLYGPVRYDLESECVRVLVTDERLLALYIIRVAEAAQQLFTIATQQQEPPRGARAEELADVTQRLGRL